MRQPESIQVIAVSFLVLTALLRRIGRERQLRVALLALMAISAILLGKFGERWISPRAASILWDWLPGALLLIPYWQVGQFFAGPDPATEVRLAAFDRSFFQGLGISPKDIRINRTMTAYLELSYFLVYPLVPVGVVALYTTGLRTEVDFYWVVVLSATYVCYGSTLLIRARPPRILPGYEGFPLPNSTARRVNREILAHASIRAITCPSAHVASALAGALVIVHLQTWIGLVFLWAALSIAAATIVGGYHYVADVLSAVFIAVLVFAVAYFTS